MQTKKKQKDNKMNKQVKTSEIFKIQLDFSRSTILIYNKDRTIMGQYPADKSIKKFMGRHLKLYIMGQYNEKTTKINILRKCHPSEINKIDW